MNIFFQHVQRIRADIRIPALSSESTLVTPRGLYESVPNWDEIACFDRVFFTDDFSHESLLNLVDKIVGGCQEKPFLLTNDEYLLSTIEKLRRELSAHQSYDYEVFTDKLKMRSQVGVDSDIPLPRYVKASDVVRNSEKIASWSLDDTEDFQCVVKPKIGSNSRGVKVLTSQASLDMFLAEIPNLDSWLIEEYIDQELWHSNAIVTDGDVRVVQVARYINRPLDLTDGRPIGSITVPVSSGVYQGDVEFHKQVLSAFPALDRGVTHLEYFRYQDGRKILLEIAARAPGGLVSQMCESVTGLNLEVENFRQQMGLRPPGPKFGGYESAWLWFPFANIGEKVAKGRLMPSVGVLSQLKSPYKIYNYIDVHRELEVPAGDTIVVFGILLRSKSSESLEQDLALLTSCDVIDVIPYGDDMSERTMLSGNLRL